MKYKLSELMYSYINEKIVPNVESRGYTPQEEILVLGGVRTGFQEGYNLANEKFEKAKELIEYFVNRVEEGSIKSKTTYKLYKDFLENN